jgi:hypothetical protein
VTAIEKFGCPSCGLPGEPSRALDVCMQCQSAAVEQVHGALAAEGLPRESWALTDAGLLVQDGMTCQPERAAQLLAPGSAEELARHRGRLVWLLADQVARLELQAEDFRDQLGEAGYLQLVDNDSDALHVALADAEEAQCARDVIAAHDELFENEDDVALVLEQATAVMAEHERVRGQLHEHEWTDSERSLPEAIDDVLAFTAEAQRAYELLFEHDLLPSRVDLPGAVQALITETLQVREELREAGYSCWTQPPTEMMREPIADTQEADALEQRFLRERRRSLRMADIARRALVSAHAVAHEGAINACPHCATEWAQLPACDKVAV